MKLIGSVIVRNELSRYLEPCVASLLEYCDEIRIIDDSSDDGWQEALRGAWGKESWRVLSKRRDRGGPDAFLRHAAGRNELLQFALEGFPTHVLAIDADEFASDGAAIRRACEAGADAIALEMCEVWEACEERLCVRADGGWRPHPVTMVWQPSMPARRSYRIRDRGPATGRTPENRPRPRAEATAGACFHFGWARAAERAARAQRYAETDGGQFHAKAHLDSILWPPGRVRLEGWAWPAALEPRRAELLARAGAKVPA